MIQDNILRDMLIGRLGEQYSVAEFIKEYKEACYAPVKNRLKLKTYIDVSLEQCLGGDYSVVAAAKVSTGGEAVKEFMQPEYAEKSEGLINYLMEHRHGTPFEHNCFTYFVHAPIFVWREWHRHRVGFSYNEESGRYKQLEPVFYLPSRERPMMKVEKWKAGRPKFELCEDDAKFARLCENLVDDYIRSYAHYEENLEMGFDPGLARDGLNVGIFSSCWVTCNARSVMHFLSLRTHEPTAAKVSYPLYEIEVAARKVEALFAEKFPITYKAFLKFGRVAP